MRVFKNTWFARFASKEGIQDGELISIVNNVLEKDLAEADLGGGVYKVRVARSGEGKSGGYRFVVFFRSEDKTFYQYAFPKSKRSNINKKELQFYKKLAKTKLAMTEKDIDAALKAGELIEVKETI